MGRDRIRTTTLTVHLSTFTRRPASTHVEIVSDSSSVTTAIPTKCDVVCKTHSGTNCNAGCLDDQKGATPSDGGILKTVDEIFQNRHFCCLCFISFLSRKTSSEIHPTQLVYFPLLRSTSTVIRYRQSHTPIIGLHTNREGKHLYP